jgi:hypothetical protein
MSQAGGMLKLTHLEIRRFGCPLSSLPGENVSALADRLRLIPTLIPVHFF